MQRITQYVYTHVLIFFNRGSATLSDTVHFLHVFCCILFVKGIHIDAVSDNDYNIPDGFYTCLWSIMSILLLYHPICSGVNVYFTCIPVRCKKPHVLFSIMQSQLIIWLIYVTGNPVFLHTFHCNLLNHKNIY